MTCTAKESWKQAVPFLIAEDICKLRIAVAAACERKTQGEAAEVYASYGVPVFPCDWRLKKQKDGLKKVSKGPLPELGKGGLYLATADLEQVRSWWQRWPDALIGVPMGRRVGIWAVDVDHKDAHAGDGIEAWYRLEVQHGSAGTRSHLTGTNGLHHFYLWNSNNPIGCSKGKLPPGMEVKGEGGYVIFPPSPYVREGKAVCYSVSNDRSPEPAPPWLYDLILGKREGAKGNGGDNTSAGGYTWSPDFGPRKLNEFCELVRSAQKGHWDEARRRVFKFGRWVGGGAMDINEALDALENAARQSGAPADYLGEVKRAFLNGVAQPEAPQLKACRSMTSMPTCLNILTSMCQRANIGPRAASMHGFHTEYPYSTRTAIQCSTKMVSKSG